MWMYSFIDPIPMRIPSDLLYMPFYSTFSIIQNGTLISQVIAFSIILFQGLLLVQFNKRHILINHRTYLPAFFYVLIASSFVHLHRLNPVIIGSLFIFISINFIFDTYRSDYALNRLYIAGFFIAIASLIWAPFAVIFVIIWISLMILRPFIGREWIVGLLGFLTPFLFIFVYYYVFASENNFNLLLNSYLKSFDIAINFSQLHFSYYIFYGIIVILILASSYVLISNFQKKKIKTRKLFLINWWLFFLGMLLFILFKYVKYEILYLITIPLSYLLTDYFYYIKRKWVFNTIIVLLILSEVYIQIVAHY